MEGVVAGYRVLRRLGSGDGSDVYLAVPSSDAGESAPEDARGLVALKILRERAPNGILDREIRTRCLLPAGRVADLHDVASLPDGRICLVLEYLSGPTLARVLAADRPLSPGEVVTALAPIVQAVAELYDLGLVQYRIIPPSVRFDEIGRARLGGLRGIIDLPEPGKDRAAAVATAWTSLISLCRTVAARASEEQRAKLEAVLAAARAPSGADGSTSFRDAAMFLERALFAWSPAAPIGLAPQPGAAGGAGAVTGLLRVAASGQSGPVGDGPGEHALTVRRIEAVLEMRPVDALRRWAGRAIARRGERRRGWMKRVSGRGPVLYGAAILAAASVGSALAASMPSPGPLTAPAAPSGAIQTDGTRNPAPTMTQAVAERADAGRIAEEQAHQLDQAVLLADDPAMAASVLLRLRAACLAKASIDCLATIDQPESPALALDSAFVTSASQSDSDDQNDQNDQNDLPAQQAAGIPPPVELILVDRIGDLALLADRSGPGNDQPASVLLVKGEAGWRVRAVFGD
jgi:hypothetical protein